jgi:hypothetical protein
MLTTVALFLLFATPAGAEMTKAKGQVVYHVVKAEVIKVDDVPGHVIGIVDFRGLNLLDTGEIATWTTKVMFDYTNGNGTHWANTQTTFEDGSITRTKGQGTTTSLPSGVSEFKGTYNYIGGTGRWEGIKGEGTYSGKRMAPLTPGGPADCYQEWSETRILPSR